jgi:hypothetical protein
MCTIVQMTSVQKAPLSYKRYLFLFSPLPFARSFEAQLSETRGFFQEYNVPASLAKRVAGLQMLKVRGSASVLTLIDGSMPSLRPNSASSTRSDRQ